MAIEKNKQGRDDEDDEDDDYSGEVRNDGDDEDDDEYGCPGEEFPCFLL